GYGIRDTWIDPAEAVPALTPTTVEEVNTKVVELAELQEHDIHDFHALLEDARMTLQETVWTVEEEAYAARVAWNHSIGLSQATYQELQTYRDHTAMAKLQEINRKRQVQLIETLRVVRDMRREMSDMQKELISQREQLRRERQPGPDARFLDHQEVAGDTESHPKLLVRQIMVRTRRGQTPPPTNPNNMTPEAVQTMINQALMRNSDGGDGSH
nr:hypothetical protein [Tanacetum cinerariifolium]